MLEGDLTLLWPVLLPLVAGAILPFVKSFRRRDICNCFVGVIVVATLVLVLFAAAGKEKTLTVWDLMEGVPVYLKLDAVGKLFYVLTAVMWIPAAFYSFDYMKHEKQEPRYYSFFLLTLAVLLGISSAGNLITMYLFYEGMSLTTLGLIIHNQSKEAVAAGHKHIFYSIGGALLGLFGFFFISYYGTTLEFIPGGVLDPAKIAGNESLLLVVFFFMIVGFGSKAGMFPLHGWLSAAHPVAPAPASALLSGNITKMGVLAILRVVYYIAGTSFLRGTWVQYAWIGLTLLTIFMGSMLAYKEDGLKKRLAYSSVSQVSYVLFGLSLMHPVAFLGALLHVVYHCVTKNTLFLTAGAMISKTGKHLVSELSAIGKQMPVTLWCFTLASITLVGIPPTSAFVSKWYLAAGAMEQRMPYVWWLGPLVLLISALLTAGYLFSIMVRGFFPGKNEAKQVVKKEAGPWMIVPMLCLTAAAVVFGMIPGGLVDYIVSISAVLFH